MAAREAPLNAGLKPADFADKVIDSFTGPKINKDLRQVMIASMSAVSVPTYRDALTCFSEPPELIDFSTFTCPTLMMTGRQDPLATPERMADIAAQIRVVPGRSEEVRFHVIEEAGHLCNLEQPDHYNRHLIDFIASL